MWYDDNRPNDLFPHLRKAVGLLALVVLFIVGRALALALFKVVFGGESG